jgi:hypothetical protein
LKKVLKKHFFLKLNPPRSSFAKDMTNEEKNTMQKHVEYWTSLLNDRVATVFGPVFDP